jgi:hypothetical protein
MAAGRLPDRGPARQARGLPACSRALSQPDGIGAQDAPKLAGAGQVAAVARPEGEVLGIARETAADAGGSARRSSQRAGEPIIWIGPRVSLLGVSPRLRHALRELREVMTAALADSGERHRVPGQAQSDLVGLADPVPTADRVDGQHGAINAA